MLRIRHIVAHCCVVRRWAVMGLCSPVIISDSGFLQCARCLCVSEDERAVALRIRQWRYVYVSDGIDLV